MKIISINNNDTTNSITGFTMSIFFSGCNHKCIGCFSQNTWEYNSGTEYSIDKILKLIKINKHKNVSLLGGDPLFYKNREEVIKLIYEIKNKTNKKIYLWTGYPYEQVSKWIDLSLIDYLIDNKFDIGKRDIKLKLRGSSNQRVFMKGKDITKELDYE